MAVLSNLTIRFILATGLVASCLQCTRRPTDLILGSSDIQVHGFLRAGDDSAVVYVGKSLPDRLVPEPATGLEVVLIREADTLELTERRSGVGQPCWPGASADTWGGCYEALVPGGIASGDHFELSISGPGVPPIYGAVVVPQPPIVVGPPPDSAIELVCAADEGACTPPDGAVAIGAFRLRWSSLPDIGRIEAVMDADSARLAGSDVAGSCHVNLLDGVVAADARSDAVTVAVLRVGCRDDQKDLPWDLVHTTAWVTGYDTAFARYRRATEQSTGTAAPADVTANISGAHGFIAGLATTGLKLRMRR